MPWVYLDDKFTEHPKVVAAGGDAAWLYLTGLCWVQRNLTRGLIPKELVSRLSDRKQPKKLAERLVKVGLWEDAGEAYRIHDYEEHNESAMKRSEAARKAANKRWKNTVDDVPTQCERISENDANALPTQSPRADARPSPTPSLSNSPPTTSLLAVASAGEGEDREQPRHVPAHVLKALRLKAKADGWEHFEAAMKRFRADGTLEEYRSLAERFPDARPDQIPQLADKGPLFRQFVERESVGA